MPNKKSTSSVKKRNVPPGSQDTFLSKYHLWLTCALLFGAVVCVFAPGLGGQFMFYDEYGPLLINTHVNHGITWQGLSWAATSSDYGAWYPMTWLSNMIDFQLYGSDPWGHHLTNILLHAANAVLLFLGLRKMTGAWWQSLIVAALFAFHPTRVGSVAWVTERRDMLNTLFWLLSMLAYISYAQAKARAGSAGILPAGPNGPKHAGRDAGAPSGTRRNLAYGLALVFLLFGLMSKSMVVTLPFVFLLLDYWPLRRFGWAAAQPATAPGVQPSRFKRELLTFGRLVLEKVPFFLVCLVISVIANAAQQKGGWTSEMPWLTLTDRVENALVSYVRYLGLFFYPVKLCLMYPHPGHWAAVYVWLSVLLLAVVTLAAWLLRRRAPYFIVGWLWFVGTLVPVIQLVQLVSRSIADHYTYVTSIGVGIVVVWGLTELAARWRVPKLALGSLTAAALLACVVLTEYEIPFWKNDDTVWSRAIAVTTSNYVAHCNLGIVLTPTDPDRALSEFQKSVDIFPRYREAQRSLASMLHQRGRLDEAIQHYQAGAEIKPTDGRILFGWGVACAQKGNIDNIDEAIVHIQNALSINGGIPEWENALISLLMQRDRTAEAIPVLRGKANRLGNDPGAFNDLGLALLKDKQFDEAIGNFQKALALAPNAGVVRTNLAAAISAKAQQLSTPAASTNQPPPH